MLLGILLVKAASASFTSSLVTLNALAARAAFQALLRNQIVESTRTIESQIRSNPQRPYLAHRVKGLEAFTGRIQPLNEHIRVP